MAERYNVFVQLAHTDAEIRNKQIKDASGALNRAVFEAMGVMVKSDVEKEPGKGINPAIQRISLRTVDDAFAADVTLEDGMVKVNLKKVPDALYDSLDHYLRGADYYPPPPGR